MARIRIAVVGNCQVTGLGRCLEALSPEIEVVTSAVLPAGGMLLPRELYALAQADLVIAFNAERPEYQAPEFLDATARAEFIEAPVLAFRAFHPDTALVLVDGVPLANPIVSTWNSLILAWAYSRGWTVERALALFTDEFLGNLGYLDYWHESSRALDANFSRLGFNFDSWIQAVQRTGVFMHGMNHPGIFAQGSLAVQVVKRIGLESRMPLAALPRYIDDPLWQAVWPVHLPIARTYGVVASEFVRGHGGLVEFREFASRCYVHWGETVPPDSDFTFPNNLPEVRRLEALVGVSDASSV